MALTYIIHKVKYRPWGFEAVVTIYNDGVPIEGVVTPPWDHDPSSEEIDSAITIIKVRMQSMLDYESIRSRILDDVGPEIREAVFWLIRGIRQYPNVTFIQAESAWDAEFADSLFVFDRLVNYVRNIAGGITWDQFKTYVINHKFEGIDQWQP